MKITINNEQTKNKTLEFNVNFWTGKAALIYDGIQLTKIKRNIFEYKLENESFLFEIKGNQLTGINLIMFGNQIEIERKLTWYEIALSILVIIPCFLFGAVGGAIGGGLGFTNMMIIKKINKLHFKILVSVEFCVLGFLLSYIFASLILKIIFPIN